MGKTDDWERDRDGKIKLPTDGEGFLRMEVAPKPYFVGVILAFVFMIFIFGGC